jgi:hypothetical protein
MNDINTELLQMKIEGLCLDYPTSITLDDLIDFSEMFCEDLGDFGDDLIKQNKDDGKDILLFAAACTLRLIVDYLEQDEQDDVYKEGYFISICAHMHQELCKFADEIIEDDDLEEECNLLYNAAELFWLFFRILGEPMEKKKFQNSL